MILLRNFPTEFIEIYFWRLYFSLCLKTTVVTHDDKCNWAPSHYQIPCCRKALANVFISHSRHLARHSTVNAKTTGDLVMHDLQIWAVGILNGGGVIDKISSIPLFSLIFQIHETTSFLFNIPFIFDRVLTTSQIWTRFRELHDFFHVVNFHNREFPAQRFSNPHPSFARNNMDSHVDDWR